MRPLAFCEGGCRAIKKQSHGLIFNGLVVDLEEFLLVEDHLLSGQSGDLVSRRQFDGVDRAGFFAHAAVDASKFVDVELLRIFLAVVPGAFLGNDVDAIGRAGGRAHEARDATDPAVVILIQSMDAPEVIAELSAFFDGSLIPLFFGILDDPDGVLVLPVAADVLEGVPERGAQSAEDLRQIEPLGGGELLRGHVDDVIFAVLHGKGSVGTSPVVGESDGVVGIGTPPSAGTISRMARLKTSGTAKRGDDVETRIGWRMAGIGMETASYVLGGVFLGWLAKEGFGGGDGWIVGGAIAGIASGISQMIRSGLKLNRQLDRATGKKSEIRPDDQPRESGSESESKAG